MSGEIDFENTPYDVIAPFWWRQTHTYLKSVFENEIFQNEVDVTYLEFINNYFSRFSSLIGYIYSPLVVHLEAGQN